MKGRAYSDPLLTFVAPYVLSALSSAFLWLLFSVRRSADLPRPAISRLRHGLGRVAPLPGVPGNNGGEARPCLPAAAELAQILAELQDTNVEGGNRPTVVCSICAL